jgi:hypothetical protein
MVGPSTTPSERERGMRRLRLFVVGLVASSSGLVALYADATLPWIVGIVAVGALVGVVCWRFLVDAYVQGVRGDERRRDDDFEKRERFK